MLDQAAELASNLSRIFRIPPDADDTGCHHALHARLAALAPLLPRAAAAIDRLNAPAPAAAPRAAASSGSGSGGGPAADAGPAAPAAEAAAGAGGMFALLKRYAYKPGSALLGPSLLDPRSYAWLHAFLHQHSAHLEDIALVTTWLQVRLPAPAAGLGWAGRLPRTACMRRHYSCTGLDPAHCITGRGAAFQ